MLQKRKKTTKTTQYTYTQTPMYTQNDIHKKHNKSPGVTRGQLTQRAGSLA